MDESFQDNPMVPVEGSNGYVFQRARPQQIVGDRALRAPVAARTVPIRGQHPIFQQEPEKARGEGFKSFLETALFLSVVGVLFYFFLIVPIQNSPKLEQVNSNSSHSVVIPAEEQWDIRN